MGEKHLDFLAQSVAIAVRNVSGRRRWSKLSEWLASKKSKIRSVVRPAPKSL
jgi:hypothetical protein